MSDFNEQSTAEVASVPTTVLTTVPTTVPTAKQFCVVIPYMFSNITRERVAEVFESQNYGHVSDVNFLAKTDNRTGKKYKMAFVYFDAWTCAAGFRESLAEGKTFRIVYNDPAYWTVTAFVKKSARRNAEHRFVQESADESNMQLTDVHYVTMVEAEMEEARQLMEDAAQKLELAYAEIKRLNLLVDGYRNVA